jgi:hypothetical protein
MHVLRDYNDFARKFSKEKENYISQRQIYIKERKNMVA